MTKDKELDLVFNRITDAVISVDREWKYTFLNNAALATHSLGREETLGKVLWDVHPEMVGTIFWDAYHKAMNSGIIVEIESYYAGFDKWFAVKAYPSDTGLTIFYQDITESKTIRNQLINSEEKYRTLFLKSPLPMWLYDFESLLFIEVNEAAIQHYGYTRDEFLSMSIKDIRPQEDIEQMLDDIAQMRKNSDSTRYSNWKHQKKNGEIIIVETTSYAFNHNQRTVRMVIVNDITQKTITEQKLLENQTKLSEAQAIGHISNWDIDLLKNTHTWSDELYKIYGLNKLETEPSIELFLSFIHPEERDIAKSLINKALHDFSESKIDFRFRTYTGEKRYGHIEWRFDYDINKKPVRLFGILQDITARKKAEESSKKLESQIREQKIQEQKKISKAIIKAQEQQRNHIAQELHDNINQILFDAKVHLDIAGRTNHTIKKLIKYPLEQINNSMQEIRLLCQNLAAPITDIQLQEIINDLIDKYKENEDNPIKIKFSYQIPFKFSDDLKLNIYRIIQEQLHNIHKHAAARNVNIELFVKKRCIHIIVQDDGKGYNVKLKRRGLGISNIKHRVEAFNGKIKIQSKLGEGCKTEIMIPYES